MRRTPIARTAVPFLSLRGFSVAMDRDIDDAILRVADSGAYVLSDEVSSFENEWAEYCGTSYAVSVGNGLAALELALVALGVGTGDEVLVPENTFIATWMAVSNIGAIPVPVQTSSEDFNLDVSKMAARLTRKTKAVVPVHLYGRPADLNAVLDFGRSHGLAIVEDAAQAHGAIYMNSRIGGHSDAVAWSFYPGKNLGAYGDGGAVTTNSKRVARSVMVLRNYGSTKKYYHERIGTNSRLDSIQAAVLRAKLPYLTDFSERREKIAARYQDHLKATQSDQKNANSLILPPSDDNNFRSAWHIYAIRVAKREKIRIALRSAGIETGIHYPVPIGLQAPYKSEYRNTVTRHSLRDAKKLLSLPMGPHLTEKDVDYVVKHLRLALTKTL